MTRAFLVFLALTTLAAGLVEGAVTVARRRGWRQLRARMVADMQEGGLQALLRARVAGTRVALGDSADVELVGELAYVDALLEVEYGVRARGEAERALVRAEGARGAGPAVARGLLALGDGDHRRAEGIALAAIEGHREDPRPSLLLARARLAAGDLRAASQALEAAMVKGPRATAPIVDWAEVRLDVGQPAAALVALGTVLARAPEHTRAGLLREEAQLATGGGFSDGLVERCRRDGRISPVVAAWCSLRAALGSRLRGDRVQALAEARAAGRDQRRPRLRGQAAVALAQLGRVDEAAALLAREPAPERSPMAWAQAAVALGRGELPALPELTPSRIELRLLVARRALAAAGPPGLTRALVGLGDGAVQRDPDLRALSMLVRAQTAVPEGPVRAYAEGLRARLAGDAATSARALAGALEGHGDTCRAAGEYLAVLRVLRQPPGRELEPVHAANSGCLNLALPPPLHEPPARRRHR